MQATIDSNLACYLHQYPRKGLYNLYYDASLFLFGWWVSWKKEKKKKTQINRERHVHVN